MNIIEVALYDEVNINIFLSMPNFAMKIERQPRGYSFANRLGRKVLRGAISQRERMQERLEDKSVLESKQSHKVLLLISVSDGNSGVEQTVLTDPNMHTPRVSSYIFIAM
jgi:hypothetical protein